MEQENGAIMEESLIGYLLGSLDPTEQQSVEEYLMLHPEAGAKLDALRQAMEPLAIDQDAFSPPSDLAIRTIAHVAEYLVNTEPRPVCSEDTVVSHYLRSVASQMQPISPRAPTPRQLPATADELELNTVFRRNIIAAIGLAIAFLAIAFPTIAGLRHYRNLESCQNNLRQYSLALNNYADLNNGSYPLVKPDETAGKMMDVLHKAGLFPPGATLTCPGAEYQANQPVGTNAKIDYAYSLGYRDDSGNLQGLNREVGDRTWCPLLADAPLRTNDTAIPNNHRRVHQVLFADGHVLTSTNGNVGYAGDNIFYNMDSQVHAGVNLYDSVLGRPDEQP